VSDRARDDSINVINVVRLFATNEPRIAKISTSFPPIVVDASGPDRFVVTH
jgi:hypothetical protein